MIKEPTPKSPDEMSEAELAEYFYTHRADLAGDEVASRPLARMDVMISARFSRAEAAEVRAAAERATMSVSAFLRQCVLAALSTNVQSKATDALQALTNEQPQSDGA